LPLELDIEHLQKRGEENSNKG